VRPNQMLVWPTKKVGSTSSTSGKVSLEPCHWLQQRYTFKQCL